MIITFHIAVCIVQRLWASITTYIDTTNNNQGLDDSNSHESNLNIEIDNDNGFQDNEASSLIEPRQKHNLMLPSPTIEECDLKTNSQEDKDEEVIHTISFGDLIENDIDIRKLIYDIELTFECVCDERGLRFIPPVYIQRYIAIENILKEPCWANTVKKIVDFGCAELKFENLYLKKLPGIEEIIAVDLDESLLTYNSCKLEPSIPEYLTRRHSPLKIRILSGSVANTNEALVGCDAVVAIELIEHLFPPDLENLPFTVFGFIKPRIAMFTTPNAEFNVLFVNFSGLRHDDHKFEWTRHEFEAWANNLVIRYPEYSVTFQGVGPGPAGTDHLGCCSQMATFVKVFGCPKTEEFEMHTQDGDYKLINEYIYPFDQRTREEIIRDDALAFINQSILHIKRYNEHAVKEIHLKTIMNRSKCLDREKLKNILRENNWQVETNEDGQEVVIVPDSDYEDELSSNTSEEYHEQEQHLNLETDFSNVDEDWDSVEKESNNCENDTSNPDLANDNNEHYRNTCHDSLVYRSNKMGSGSEKSVSSVDVNTSKLRSDTLSEKELVTDCSIYETPQFGKLTSQLPNKSSHDQNITVEDCKKALAFGTPDSYSECNIKETALLNESHGGNEKPKLFCCLSYATMASDTSSRSGSSFSHNNVVSPFNSSVYNTPCCSKFHKNNKTKSLSLQEINSDFDRPLDFPELNSLSKLPDLTLNQRDKTSKSMEGFKTQDSCDTEKTGSNDSKVVDSGYLDSCSEHNMELDLTPEQFDEIESESESASPLKPPVHILHVIDDVENGDVVNNNRDGEGNNMVEDIEEELMGFEAQIEEVNNEIPNLAAEHQFHLQEINQCRNELLSPGERSVDMEVESQEFEAKIEGIKTDSDLTSQSAFHCNERSQELPNILEKSINQPDEETNENVSGCATANKHSILIPQKFDKFSNGSNLSQKGFALHNVYAEDSTLNPSLDLEENHVLDKNTICKTFSVLNLEPENEMCKSDLCTAKSNSGCHLNSSKSTIISCSMNESINKNDTDHKSSELTVYNSLTTVIDGCSKFSECSLVQPIHIFPKWMQRIDIYDFKNDTCEQINSDNSLYLCPSEEVTVSISSDYESAASLLSEAETCPFPTWLLNIDVIENYDHENRISDMSIIDNDSLVDMYQTHYYEQVDTRAGGDQDSTH